MPGAPSRHSVLETSQVCSVSSAKPLRHVPRLPLRTYVWQARYWGLAAVEASANGYYEPGPPIFVSCQNTH